MKQKWRLKEYKKQSNKNRESVQGEDKYKFKKNRTERNNRKKTNQTGIKDENTCYVCCIKRHK